MHVWQFRLRDASALRGGSQAVLSAHPGEERELQRGEESKRAAMAEERVSLGVAGGGVDEEARRCQPQDFGSMNQGDLRKAARDPGVKQWSRSLSLIGLF